MPCDDCGNFRTEIVELKEFVAKWFSVLLKRFDCQDRKLVSLTEAICGEDIISDIANDAAGISNNIATKIGQNNANGKLTNATYSSSASFKDSSSMVDESCSNSKLYNTRSDSLKCPRGIKQESVSQSEYPKKQLISSASRISSKRRKFSQPVRKSFPVVVELRETTVAKIKKYDEHEEQEDVGDDDADEMYVDNEEDINDETPFVDDEDQADIVPSTSNGSQESLHEGQRFDSMKEFMAALTRYEFNRGINLIVADSKKVETANKRVKPGSLSWDPKFKYCYFELRCSRAGMGEQCPFRLLVINSKTERRLVITKMVDVHHQFCSQNGIDELCRTRLLKRLL